MKKIRVIIIGCTLSTRRFIYEILNHPEYLIVAIVTLRDDLAYKKARFVLLDDIASENNIKLYKVSNINDQKVIKIIVGLKPDLILEAGWSQIISDEIIKIPKIGCIGIHNSYLPQNQGAASLNWAIIKNEKEWGVTLFSLIKEIDKGDIIDQSKFPVEIRDDINTLFDKADSLAVELLRKNLPLISIGETSSKKQNKKEVTYLPRRTLEDGRIDWEKRSSEIHNLIRAITKPYPGAYAFFKNRKVFIWSSELVSKSGGKSGKILGIISGEGVVVGTGKGKILLRRVQFENDIEMWADQFAKKYLLRIYEKLD